MAYAVQYNIVRGRPKEVLVYHKRNYKRGFDPHMRVSHKNQAGSNAASMEAGQSPKDKGLAALDNDVASRILIDVLTRVILGIEKPVKVRKGKPSKAKGHDKLTRKIRRKESTHRSKPKGKRRDTLVYHAQR